MDLSDFDYDLPGDLIAQEPLDDRSASRLLAIDRRFATFVDRSFTDFPLLVRDGDVIVLNDTKVFPARLFGRSETGREIEVFLVRDVGDGKWEVLAKPGRRLRTGGSVTFGNGLTATVIEKSESGRILAHFDSPDGRLEDVIDKIGRTPLPPYIKRDAAAVDRDRDRYQTIYASSRGAIAAPTAGLHFTPEVLKAIENAEAEICRITLHVGYGTFEPVKVRDLAEHRVLPEDYEISPAAAELLNRAKRENRRVVAIGTTTARALESNYLKHGTFTEERSSAELTITPGYKFGAVDALLTNFHLPGSSLLILVSTFGGHELIMKAYRHAVRSRYRFYSYGDCMFIQ